MPPLPWTDNEETEGSDVPTDYLLGDVEGEDDELYLLDPEHAHCKWGRGEGMGRGWEAGPEAQSLSTLPAPVSQPRSPSMCCPRRPSLCATRLWIPHRGPSTCKTRPTPPT